MDNLVRLVYYIKTEPEKYRLEWEYMPKQRLWLITVYTNMGGLVVVSLGFKNQQEISAFDELLTKSFLYRRFY